MLSELELMEIHVNVLFKHDVAGRMTLVNEPPHDVAPRYFVGGTKGGNLVRYLNTLGHDVVEELERAIGTEPGAHLAEIIIILSQHRQISSIGIGPTFLFPDVRNRSTQAIQITQSNKTLLRHHFPYTFDEFEYKQPCFAIVQNGVPVSICCSARQTSRAAEASLFTHEDCRGRAYGVDVSNAWAAEVQNQGRIALYSTSWDNFASQAVARKLQLMQYGTDVHIG